MFADFEKNNNNDDYLDDYRQKLNSPSADIFEERKNEINHSKNVFIGTVSGIALAAVVGWFVLSPRYASDMNVEIPIIRRPQAAIKVQPSEPGGMEIQNQDKSIYDIIEKKQNKAPMVENLLPPPEVPQLPVVTAETSVPLMNEESAIAKKAEEIINQAEEKAIAPAAIIQAENVKIAAPTPAVAVKEETPPAKEITIKEASLAEKTATSQPTQKTNDKVEIPAQAVPVAPINTQTTPQVAIGNWQVQLISSPNRKAVDTAWDGLTKKYPSLQGQQREIETADLGAKGTYYRLKAGAFVEKSDADKLCNDIKALGGTCIVKKK